MRSIVAILIVLTCSANAMAICEYSRILDTDEYERFNYSMKVDKLTEKSSSISFEQRDISPDEISRDCLACHDGSLGSGGNVRSAHEAKSAIQGSHPIGVDFNNISYKKSGYRNIHNIRPSIKFVDGRLGCLSCHNIQNKEKKHLVVSLNGSALCFECHAK